MPPNIGHPGKAPQTAGVIDFHGVDAVMFGADTAAEGAVVSQVGTRERLEVPSFGWIDSSKRGIESL